MTTKLARSQLKYLQDWEPAILAEFGDWVGDLVGELRSAGCVLLSVMESEAAGMLTVWCGTRAASRGREGWSIQFDAPAADVNAWMGERDSHGTWWLITKREGDSNGVALEVGRNGSLTGLVCGA